MSATEWRGPSKKRPLPGIEWVILGGGLGEKLVDIELSGF